MEIFLELDKEFHFTLDPTDRPIAHLPGLKDGLRMKYGSRLKPARVYCNPPYERGLVEAYVARILREMKLGRVTIAVFLIPLRNSDYFKLLRKHGAEFRLCEKRLKFGDADNSSKSNGSAGAPFDSVVAVLNNPFMPEIVVQN